MPSPRPDRPSPTAERGFIAHLLRKAMSYDFRVSVDAGARLSCIGRVVRIENDPSQVSKIPEGGSTLTAFIDTGEQVIEVPVGAIQGVART